MSMLRSHRAARRLALLASAVVLVVSGCAGSSAPTGSSQSSGGPVDANGVLRMAYDLSGASGSPPTFDPSRARTPGADVPWQVPVYDSLMRYTSSGALEPGLAQRANVVDPRTVTIDLRPGLVFSDGTPFDSAAVKAAILRNRAAPRNGQFQSSLYDVSTIDTPSSTSLTVHLAKPGAGAFYSLLGGPETFVGSPKATDPATAPIGAGPFKVKEFTAGQRIVLVKNPRYWDAKDIHLAEIDITSVPAGPQQVNAVESGSVDFSVVQPSDVTTIQSNSSLRLLTRAADSSLLWMPLCKSQSPLNNVEVRRALNYAIDREAIDHSLLHGTGEPAAGLWPKESVFYPKGLADRYPYNPKKAKQLLRQAGYGKGFDLKAVLLPGVPVAGQAAQIVQSEWKEIGVHLKIEQSTNYVVDLYQHRASTGVNPTLTPGLGKLNALRPGLIGNLCDYDNARIDAIAAQLDALAPTSPAAVKLWNEVQEIVVDQALSIYLDFLPVAVATSAKVADADLITSYLVTIPDYHTVHLTG